MKLSYLALSVCALSFFATAQQADLNPTPAAKGSNPKLIPQTKGQTKNVAANVPTRQGLSGSQLLASTGTDSCTTPDVLTGTGTFLVDTTTSTTGVEGQAEALCLYFGSTVIDNDVWFTWTAPASGLTIIDLCPYTAADSKIAVYDGNTCPAAPAIACVDDTCGFTTTISFNAVSGQAYTFQFGSFPAAATYATSFDLTQPVGLPEDSCATPNVLVGPGPYSHDSTGATTGVEGQTEAPCLFFGSTVIDQDNWYTWTSVTGGVATVSFCGVTGSADSKVAIYPGTGCPTAGTAIACDDDACVTGTFESTLSFPSTAGNTYTIQAGSFPGAPGYAGSFTITETPILAEDDCSTPLGIAPTGPYAYDNTTATTGVDGQNEALCAPTPLGINNDLWFTWASPFTGTARMTTCTLATADTKIAVYPAGGCPVVGSSIACNDDTCGLQSEVTWAATTGTTYLLQVGNWPGGAPAAGAFDITQFFPLPEDDCSTPIAIVGPGPHNFDNSIATNGTQGQFEAECEYWGLTGINRDVWYTWTAPSSGKFDISTMGLTTVDTKIAVYDGAGCPVTPAIACGDDACGIFQSAMTFVATGGNQYTFQIGTYPNVGGAGGPGQFTVTPNTYPDAGCSLDDGIANTAFRAIDPTGTIILPSTGWIQRYGQLTTTTGIFGVEVAWGGVGGAGVAAASPAEIVLLDDPNDDGDPSDCVVVEVVAVTTANENTSVLNTYLFATPHVMTGYFFIGAGLAHGNATFPAAVDRNTCVIDRPERAFLIGDISGVNNWASLPANTTFVGMDGYDNYLGTTFLLRGLCQVSPGTEMCSNSTLGVDHTTPCPCGNAGTDPLAGCANNSIVTTGARLTATGMRELDNPSDPGQVLLTATGTTGATSFTLFIQHAIAGDEVMHDGVICTANSTPGHLIRLRGRNAGPGQGQPNNQAIFPNNLFANDSTLTLHSRGGVVVGSGATRYYAAFYRAASPTFCPPATANVTNGVTIVW